MEAFNAETQLLYASDWPHWDFDPPSSITTLPFLSEQAKRNILGLNAARLFNLEVKRMRPKADGRAGGAAGRVVIDAAMALTRRPRRPQWRCCGDDFVAAAEHALSSGELGRVSDAELERVMTAAVRLYAAKAETDTPPAAPITPASVTPTDVVVTVSDMIRAAGLNLWDVSMWFNRMKS